MEVGWGRPAGVCACECVCESASTLVCILVRMCRPMCVYEHNYVWVCMHIWEWGCLYACLCGCVCVRVCSIVSTPGCVCLRVHACLFFEVWVAEFTICNAQLILSACIYRGIEHLLKWAWLCHSLPLHPLWRQSFGRPSAERGWLKHIRVLFTTQHWQG